MTITALIRTHKGRHIATIRAAISAKNEGCESIVMDCPTVSDYSYNLFCNDLKSQATDGYFFFLDSDDVVIPGAIDKIRPHLRPDRALIVQMLRNGRPKPRYEPVIRRGAIGMPCMVLHHSMKDVADVTATVHGDYDWIKAVTDKVPYYFLPVPLVDAGRRSHGK